MKTVFHNFQQKSWIDSYYLQLQAVEYAKKNITINCVSPGFIVSDMTSSIPEKIKSILLSKIPMGKMGSGDDVSNCVGFLSSDEASYITGETIHVNGGMYMA